MNVSVISLALNSVTRCCDVILTPLFQFCWISFLSGSYVEGPGDILGVLLLALGIVKLEADFKDDLQSTTE